MQTLNLSNFWSDFIASIIVFLVAVPLCMGIAIASGVPPAVGLLTGVIGGVVIGSLSGSPLQASGPAAGLVVLVNELAQQHGLQTLGLIIVLAGLFQFISGLTGLGQWFRAVPPSVIHGMLAGIGVLLISSQFQVMLGITPAASGLTNVMRIPNSLMSVFGSTWGGLQASAAVGFGTIALVVLWDVIIGKRLRYVPGSLVGIIVASVVTAMFSLPVRMVEIPANLFQSMKPLTLGVLTSFRPEELLVDALVLAFIASTETMLTAAAIDKMRPLVRTDYDKELRAQGVGNILSGFIGGLPLTGVIARSGVNVSAGAKTRLSTVLHGVWLLAAVTVFVDVLRYVTIPSLAALLVLTGYKLFLSKEAQELRKFGRTEVLIYAITVISIVVFDLLTGVIVGVVLSVGKLLHVFSHLDTRVETHDGVQVLRMAGAATFLSLPKLAAVLESIEPSTELHVEIDRLAYIDHACFDLLMHREKQHAASGGSLFIDWGELTGKSTGYRGQLLSGAGGRTQES